MRASSTGVTLSSWIRSSRRISAPSPIGVERNFVWRSFHHLAHFFLLHPKFFRDSSTVGRMAQLLREMGDFGFESIKFVFEFRRQPENLSMMRDCRQDCLPDPPTGISDESNAARDRTAKRLRSGPDCLH